MRIYAPQANKAAIAAEVAKRLRLIYRDYAARTLTIPLPKAPSTQLILGPGFECLNILLPGMSALV
jgi:hypothetical protein